MSETYSGNGFFLPQQTHYTMKKHFNILLFILSLYGGTMCAQNLRKGDYGYLYCHMSGRGEWTAYALSRDGLYYEDLINGDEVYDTEALSAIEGGARDAYICRTFDGKGYLMVTTDMSNRKSRSWYNYGINLLKSDDLIHWTSVTFDFRKGASLFSDPSSPDVYKNYGTIKRVWAPQIFWNPSYVWPDGSQGGYMIYYSLWNPDEEAYDRMYYSYANHDFTTLTKPRLMFDWGYATIDADINYVPADGRYHMLIKKEGGTPGIFAAVADRPEGAVQHQERDGLRALRGQPQVRGLFGVPPYWRQHVARGLHPVLHQSPPVPHLPSRRDAPELSFAGYHPRCQGPAARVVHDADQA